MSQKLDQKRVKVKQILDFFKYSLHIYHNLQ